MKTQFIMDDRGKKLAVILQMKEYERILEELDELECIKAFDKAKARKKEFIPAQEVFKRIETKRKNSHVSNSN